MTPSSTARVGRVEVDGLRALMERATPGPWLNGERILAADGCIALQAEDHADIYRETPDGNCNVACATFTPEDAGLIVALRNNADALLAELSTLRAEVEWLTAERGVLREALTRLVDACNNVAFAPSTTGEQFHATVEVNRATTLAAEVLSPTEPSP
jgi:hypothetical protein